MIDRLRSTARSLEIYLASRPFEHETLSYLRLPLRERARIVEENPERRTEWDEEYRGWFARADEQYRCITTLAPADAPHFRLGVKDTVDVSGVATRLGLKGYRRYPERSAVPLQRLTGGLQVTCKVATTELNIGFGAGCQNPLYPTIDPSGSSTGSAVSVAANLCDVSLGTDVLGSVRWPASHCGMVGLRMTHHEKLLDGVFPLSPRMDALGWVTRTADDLHFVFERLTDGVLHQPADQPAYGRIGIVARAAEGITSAEMREMMAVARSLLPKLGKTDTMVDLLDLWSCRGDAWQLCARDAWLASSTWHDVFDTELHWSTLNALEVGSRVSQSEYERIHAKMDAVRHTIDAAFATQEVEFLLLPADPNRPFQRREPRPGDSTIPMPGDSDYDAKVGYTPLASFAGLPALVMPLAITADGAAPLCLQIIGRRDAEISLVRFARQLEAARGPLRRLGSN